MSLFMNIGGSLRKPKITNKAILSELIGIFSTSTYQFPKSKNTMYYIMNQDGYYDGTQVFRVKNLTTGWETEYMDVTDFFLINTYFHDHELISYKIQDHYIASIEFEETKPIKVIDVNTDKELYLYDFTITNDYNMFKIIDDLSEWDAINVTMGSYATNISFYNSKTNKSLKITDIHIHGYGAFFMLGDKFKQEIDCIEITTTWQPWVQNISLIRF